MDTAITDVGAQRALAHRGSRVFVLVGIAALFFLLQIISALTPPFQSPDEFNHLKRAYLLSRGEILLGSVDGVTGGYVDTGLLDYMGTFVPVIGQYGNTISDDQIRLARTIQWSKKKRFVTLVNTAEYFPLSYMPQAMGLKLGEALGLSIETTYYSTRFVCIFTALALILLASLAYPIPLFSAAVLVLPMSLYQMSSTSLDSVAFPLSVLTASLFMRGADFRMTFTPGMHLALALGLFALATSRIVLLPLTLSLVSLYIARRSRIFLVSAFAAFAGAASWILIAVKTVRSEFPGLGSSGTVAIHYLISPLSLLQVIKATFTDREMLRYYWSSFIGLLGWNETPLDAFVYDAWGLSLILLAIISFQTNRDGLLSVGSLSLAVATTICLFLIFFIELCVATPQPAVEIFGVQGRYFIPIAILLGYSVFSKRHRRVESIVGLSTVAITTWLSIVSMVHKLVTRYWEPSG